MQVQGSSGWWGAVIVHVLSSLLAEAGHHGNDGTDGVREDGGAHKHTDGGHHALIGGLGNLQRRVGRGERVQLRPRGTDKLRCLSMKEWEVCNEYADVQTCVRVGTI